MDTFVYIDGFNLYYGALKGTGYKWLDPLALVRQGNCVFDKPGHLDYIGFAEQNRAKPCLS